MNQADMRMQTRRPFDVEGGKMPDANVPMGPPGQFPAGGEDFPPMEGGGTERIEEIAEAIIEEKWTDLMENINRIIEWKDKTETRITQLESAMKAIKDDFDKIHTSVLERVGDYDKHITDVGTEVKALEKVFQKVLPGFIENVAELSRITDDIKKSK
jgi:predicted Rossmann fold nucleotide-binding protein DprA/Smf involved in DNA uptake